MKKIVLLGTSHSIQRGENSPNQFRDLLVQLCTRDNVKVIAEEIVLTESVRDLGSGNSVSVFELWVQADAIMFFGQVFTDDDHSGALVP